jgi:membrane-associated protein
MHLFGLETLFDIEYLLTTYGYVGIFLIVFLESGIFFPLPGDSLLFTAGLFASVSGLNIFLLVPLIFFATFLGGIAGYHIGVYLEHFRRYPVLNKILKPEYIREAHDFFDKHGKLAILLSRFLPLMRTFAPIVAGIARMPKEAFIRYSLASSALWATSMTLAGYFLGRSFPQIKDYLSFAIVGIVLVSVIPAAAHYLHTRRKRSRTSV